METVYKQYKPARELLLEYYTWVDILDIEREEFKRHAESMENHAKQIYIEFERAAKREQQIEANSKSARIASKLEQMRLTNDLVDKIKLRQQLKK